MSKTVVFAGWLVLAAIALPGPSFSMPPGAQTTQPVIDGWWHERTTQGCLFYTWVGSNPVALPPEGRGLTWQGSCRPGQPINGSGVLSSETESNRYAESVTFRDGYRDGILTYALQVFYNDGWHPDEGNGDTTRNDMGCPPSRFEGCVPHTPQS